MNKCFIESLAKQYTYRIAGFFEGENFHELILLTFFAVKFSRMPLTETTMIASYR